MSYGHNYSWLIRSDESENVIKTTINSSEYFYISVLPHWVSTNKKNKFWSKDRFTHTTGHLQTFLLWPIKSANLWRLSSSRFKNCMWFWHISKRFSKCYREKEKEVFMVAAVFTCVQFHWRTPPMTWNCAGNISDTFPVELCGCGSKHCPKNTIEEPISVHTISYIIFIFWTVLPSLSVAEQDIIYIHSNSLCISVLDGPNQQRPSDELSARKKGNHVKYWAT